MSQGHSFVVIAAERAAESIAQLVSVVESSDCDLPESIAAVEAAGRLMDAARVLAVAPLARSPLEAERLGFASATAAVATLAQTSERAARSRLLLADAVSPDLSVSGAPLPARHSAVASALLEGRLGVEAASLISRELDKSASRVPVEAREVAESVMVNLACGLDPTGEQHLPPASVDYLTSEIRTIGAAIDPDGALPREERATQRRAVWIGKADDDGLVPFGGRLLPEVGGLLLGLLEAWRRSPRFVEADALGIGETRTVDQRRHDAFAEVLTAATAADETPQLNGRPVTVLVTVAAADLARPDGLDSDPIGTMAGSPFPVSRIQVERFVDVSGYRRVSLSPAGAIVGISSSERCFTGNQTLAIAARDGYVCSAPGCTTSHTALQVHHVIPWREGGPTITGNGILLCYWHHRRVDDGPWRYRMANGLPQVRGPGIPEWRRLRRELARAA